MSLAQLQAKDQPVGCSREQTVPQKIRCLIAPSATHSLPPQMVPSHEHSCPPFPIQTLPREGMSR